MKKNLALAVTAALVIGSGFVPLAAQATGPGDKITICHATGSEKNPYVTITVDRSGLNGHGDHAGDLIPAPDGGCPKGTPETDPEPTAPPTTPPAPEPTDEPTPEPSETPAPDPTTDPTPDPEPSQTPEPTEPTVKPEAPKPSTPTVPPATVPAPAPAAPDAPVTYPAPPVPGFVAPGPQAPAQPAPPAADLEVVQQVKVFPVGAADTGATVAGHGWRWGSFNR